MNSVSIIGRITAVPELRHTPQGKAVADGNLAVDDGFRRSEKIVLFQRHILGGDCRKPRQARCQRPANLHRRQALAGRIHAARSRKARPENADHLRKNGIPRQDARIDRRASPATISAAEVRPAARGERRARR